MDAQDFYKEMQKPESPDTMAFEITRPEDDDDPERSFSTEAVDAISKQIGAFMAARVLAHYNRTGKMPKRASVVVSAKMEDYDATQGMFPYYTYVDGHHREAT